MAKKSVVKRNINRLKLAELHRVKRQTLKNVVDDEELVVDLYRFGAPFFLLYCKFSVIFF